MTTTLHAHVSTSSSDCDGPMYREYVEVFNDDETAESGKAYNDFSDLHFKARILSNAVSFHATCKVEVDEDGFQYHEQTDEGYRAVHVSWCESDCDESQSSQRDVFAEQMGY